MFENNPEGVKENSPGRKPWVLKESNIHTPPKKISPERAKEITTKSSFCRPVGALGVWRVSAFTNLYLPGFTLRLRSGQATPVYYLMPLWGID